MPVAAAGKACAMLPYSKRLTIVQVYRRIITIYTLLDILEYLTITYNTDKLYGCLKQLP